MTRTSPMLRVLCSTALLLASAWPGAGRVQAGDHDHDTAGHPHVPRWSGSLERVTAQVSADGRFALDARLHTTNRSASTDNTQRFALSAQLTAPKGLPGSCAAIDGRLFSDGFE